MKVYISKDLEELIPSFLKNRHEDVVKLQEHICKRSYGEAKEISHALKGVLGSYGFQHAYVMAASIDKNLFDRNLEKITDQVLQLKKHLEEIEINFVEEEL